MYTYGEFFGLGAQVLDNFIAIGNGRLNAPSALSMLNSSGTGAVLVGHGNLSYELAHSGQWRPTAVRQLGLQLWVRGSPRWATALRAC